MIYVQSWWPHPLCKTCAVTDMTRHFHGGCSVTLQQSSPGDRLQGLRLRWRLSLDCCWRVSAIGSVYIHGRAIRGCFGCCVCGGCIWLRWLWLLPRRRLQVTIEVRVQRQQARHLAIAQHMQLQHAGQRNRVARCADYHVHPYMKHSSRPLAASAKHAPSRATGKRTWSAAVPRRDSPLRRQRISSSSGLRASSCARSSGLSGRLLAVLPRRKVAWHGTSHVSGSSPWPDSITCSHAQQPLQQNLSSGCQA